MRIWSPTPHNRQAAAGELADELGIDVQAVQTAEGAAAPEVLSRASAVVDDDPATAAGHCGPVVAALRLGDIEERELVAPGEVDVGRATARADEDDIVFYGSVGLGVQDAAAVWALIYRARGAVRTQA
ncbi:hypothetical protein [Streptomyces sp. NPDC001492]